MTEAIIKVEDLLYSYPSAPAPAVKDMSFSVARGEIFGFLGPSGAGKTTTQRILAGLLEQAHGVARVLGRDRKDWGREIYDRIGVSFELPAAYHKLTARENLQHFSRLHERTSGDIDALLASLGLEDSADFLAGSFSKGMRMRLNLAIALVHEPELLFLDEPTSGLDPVSIRRVREKIREERERGATVFLTTHDMQTADVLCDRVAFVVGGTIVACDSPRALKLASGTRQVRVEYSKPDGELRSETHALTSAPSRLIELLEAGRVERIHSTEAGLDEVFVEITGAKL
jgi:fluoroquinolone transport system ATP-binding protein